MHFTHRVRYSPFDRGVSVRCQYARAIMRASRYRPFGAAPEGSRNERRPVHIHQDAQAAGRCRRARFPDTNRFDRIAFATCHRDEAAWRRGSPQSTPVAHQAFRRGHDCGCEQPERQSYRRAGLSIGVQDLSRAGDRRRTQGRRQGSMGRLEQEGLRGPRAARYQRYSGSGQGHASQRRQPRSCRCRSAARGGLHGQPFGREFQGACCTLRHGVGIVLGEGKGRIDRPGPLHEECRRRRHANNGDGRSPPRRRWQRRLRQFRPPHLPQHPWRPLQAA